MSDLKNKILWADTIMAANNMDRTVGQVRPRTLDDMPDYKPGAKAAAILTIFAREQDFALKPVMEALEELSKLKDEDWGGKFMVSIEAKPQFSWKDQPFKSYASFKDFYTKELEETWGSWANLQNIWQQVVKGVIPEDEANRQIQSWWQLSKTIKEILETQSWRKREVDGKILTNATFREFVISAPPKGPGWQNRIEAIEEMLGRQNPDVLRQWREAMTPAKHLHHDDDNIIINPEQGTSLSYTLGRLFRDHPELYTRVIAGELSANAAAIEAGFRKRPPKRLKNCPHCGGDL